VAEQHTDDANVSGDSRLHPLRLHFEDEEIRVDCDSVLTFGREADLVIDPLNRSMHRVLGKLWQDAGIWRLINLGRSITLLVTDLEGASFARVVPGTGIPLPFRNMAIAFSAGRANYRLTVHQPAMPLEQVELNRAAGVLHGMESTITASSIVFNEEQYRLLEELARLRANGPLAGGELPSNRQLAHQLGWSLSKLNRKLDNLCLKLDRAGVTGLVGDVAEIARDRRLRLAEVAVEQGLVSLPIRTKNS
jgi:hypothetical protein